MEARPSQKAFKKDKSHPGPAAICRSDTGSHHGIKGYISKTQTVVFFHRQLAEKLCGLMLPILSWIWFPLFILKKKKKRRLLRGFKFPPGWDDVAVLCQTIWLFTPVWMIPGVIWACSEASGQLSLQAGKTTPLNNLWMNSCIPSPQVYIVCLRGGQQARQRSLTR